MGYTKTILSDHIKILEHSMYFAYDKIQVLKQEISHV